MLKFGREACILFNKAEKHYRYEISFKRSHTDVMFENLPVLALVLKRVSEEDKDVIYSLEGMICTEEELRCELAFNLDFNFKGIMDDYAGIINIRNLDN